MANTIVRSCILGNLMFWLFFQTKNQTQNTLSKDRWTILKKSNDLIKLTEIAGGKLSKKKGKRVDSGCDELSDEDSDSQSVWDLWRGRAL